MSRRIRWALTGALFALASGVAAVAQAGTSEEVHLSLDMQTVSISVTGGNVVFPGVYGSNAFVRAHTSSGSEAPAPTITNNGNVDIGSLVVTFTGPAGQEAACDGGGTWAAHAVSTAADRFVARAWASTSQNIGNFNSAKKAVAPNTGSGDILANSPLAPAATVPLLLEIQTPNPAVNGTSGCTIGLSVTAAAVPPAP